MCAAGKHERDDDTGEDLPYSKKPHGASECLVALGLSSKCGVLL